MCHDHPDPPRRIALDVSLLALLKIALGAWVLHCGFTHVSDDDYARTVIAEQFAHTPRLDPSGTSWLPLPFWLEGAAMAAAGRSLAVARGVAVVLGAGTAGLPYVAMRGIGVPRPAALLAAGAVIMLPWSAWLGVATVPEGWAGALLAGAAIATGSRRHQGWAAAALFGASLSRYEAWPACAVFAMLHAWRALRRRGGRREALWAAVALAGPLAWMAWNAHAHASALHFVARVRAFRHAIGAADIPISDKLMGYPRALVNETPEVALLGAVGAAGMVMNAALRIRWKFAAPTAFATAAFLLWGDVHDGAPTHHPARALVALWWILVAAGIDAVLAFIHSLPVARRRAAAIAAGSAAIAWSVSLPLRWDDFPGQSEGERRDAQIARGLDLRARQVTSASITPCAFEHFALIAAWGAPERADVRDRSGAALTGLCPQVVER